MTFKKELAKLKLTIADASAHGVRGCTVVCFDSAILGQLKDWCLNEEYMVRTRCDETESFHVYWSY